jgi:CHASE2 domain-containing sensor protein
VLAALIRRIAREQPAAIGVNILMSEPDRLSPDQLVAQTGQVDPTLA